MKGSRQDSFAKAIGQLPPAFTTALNESDERDVIVPVLRLLHGIGFSDGARAGAELAMEVLGELATGPALSSITAKALREVADKIEEES